MTSKVLVFGLTLCFSLSSFASNLSILSDLDDTLKVTNVQSKPEAVWNALFSKKAFKGMPALMKEMGHYTNELHILTASPNLVESRIIDFIRHHRLQVASLNTRDLSRDADTRTYKLGVIRKVLEVTGDNLVLFGDDVEIDHEVYAQIKAENPNKIAQIYVHKVTNKALPVGTIGYFTAYDVAVAEYEAGRMTANQAHNIGKKILRERDVEDIIPDFAHCPRSASEFAPIKDNELKELSQKVRAKILKYCSVPSWFR